MIPEATLDALYEAPPARFVEVRKELAQALKKGGDKEAAAELLALGKPTPAAWAVNQIARRYPAELGRLGAIGERLRSAMRLGLAGDPAASKEVAAIEKEQRACIADLAKLAASLLGTAGASASPTVIERVETTLKTIGTTGAWGGAASGRLARDLEAPSVADLASLLLDSTVPVPVPVPVPKSPAASEAAKEAAARAAREAAIREADAAVRAAAHAAKTADARVESLRREAADLRAEADRAAARVEKVALEIEAARAAERRAAELAATAEGRADAAAQEARALSDALAGAELARRALDEP